MCFRFSKDLFIIHFTVLKSNLLLYFPSFLNPLNGVSITSFVFSLYSFNTWLHSLRNSSRSISSGSPDMRENALLDTFMSFGSISSPWKNLQSASIWLSTVLTPMLPFLSLNTQVFVLVYPVMSMDCNSLSVPR